MCGFLVYKRTGNNFYIQKRGQDHANTVTINGYTFVHNLLSITGDFAPQPYAENNIVCLYNGEIYNHRFAKSDGENLIPLYKKHGTDFPKYLDGEWAIALYDFDRGRAVFATDLFATKPIWRKGLECASYFSGVGGEKIPANTIEVVDFNGHAEIKEIYEWDLNQHKENYDDWMAAFDNAVKKRATKRCFIGISSGYDSGAIACSLLKLNIPFKAYAIKANEDQNILEQRLKMMPEHEYFDSPEYFKEERAWINQNVERFDYKVGGKTVQTDSASLGLSKICRVAHLENRKVYLSGQGGDEIISDYSLKPHISTFKGVFPKDLKNHFPWNNFYDGCQYSYLGKEEYVAGSHSIETRYPFLDKDVVQEFLWLTPELKNRHYKAPIREYLMRNNFPNVYDRKIGLRIRA